MDVYATSSLKFKIGGQAKVAPCFNKTMFSVMCEKQEQTNRAVHNKTKFSRSWV